MAKITPEAIKTQCDALCALLLQKNKDYGSAIEESPYLAPEVPPTTAVFVRLSDKFKRIQTLRMNTTTDVEEPLEDSIRDVAGYCILLLAYVNAPTSKVVTTQENNERLEP